MKSQRLLIALTIVNLGLLVPAFHPEGVPSGLPNPTPGPA